MLRYLAHRLALMPITFALALSVLFVVLNLAPASRGISEEASARSREGDRAFREQFGLDRPILWSTRAWTDEGDVRALLDAIERGDAKARARAEEALLDLGAYAAEPLARLAAAGDARAKARLVPVVEGLPRGPSTVLTDTRLARFLANVLRLDFGRSFIDRTPIWPTLLARLEVSATLASISILLALGLAIPIGLYGAVKEGQLGDKVLTTALFALNAAPSFFVGTMLLELFAAGRPFSWFPAAGFDRVGAGPRTTLEQAIDHAHHLALPVLCYAAATLAALSRYARAGMIEVVNAEHVRTARAKGLPELVVLTRHVARNGLIPLLTVLGGALPALVGGSVVIEVVFGIPGVGSYLYDAIGLRDYNAVMAVLVLVSGATIAGVFLSDLAIALADPRVRLGERA